MRDAYELLYEKERQLQRIRQEVEMLRIAAPLLAEDGEGRAADTSQPSDAPNLIPFQRPNWAGAS